MPSDEQGIPLSRTRTRRAQDARHLGPIRWWGPVVMSTLGVVCRLPQGVRHRQMKELAEVVRVLWAYRWLRLIGERIDGAIIEDEVKTTARPTAARATPVRPRGSAQALGFPRGRRMPRRLAPSCTTIYCRVLLRPAAPTPLPGAALAESNDSGTGTPEADAQAPDVHDLPRKDKTSTDVEPSAADRVTGGATPREKEPYPGGPVPIPYPNLR